MLGLADPGVILAFILMFASVILCVIYGIVNWNKPNQQESDKEILEEEKWEKQEEVKAGNKK